jgi:hypothetical protein
MANITRPAIRSITTTRPADAAQAQLMLELSALRAKSEINCSLPQGINYLQSLYRELAQIQPNVKVSK